MVENRVLVVSTEGQGLYDITQKIKNEFHERLPDNGLLNVFLQHTSASLTVQENADPTARQDLEEFLCRLAPEGESWHRHTLEGPDDTTSHLKSALTQVEVTLPVMGGQLALGTWQGIYLWEHREAPHRRKVILTLYS